MEHAVEVEGVSKSFGSREVIRNVSFRVEKGETLCILGGSGGGKSTLLKVLIGALRPNAGAVRIGGRNICDLKERELDRVRLQFGVMFQSGALLNSLTVSENVALPLEHHTDLDPETIETVVKIKLQQVGLLEAAALSPAQISGGMVKRAAVARALALDPKILFYDEPSAGLDPIATARIDQLVNKLKSTMGMTNIVVTHVMESVKRIADHVIMLHSGEILLDGSVEELMESSNEHVQRFLRGDLEGFEAELVSKESYHRDLLM